MVVPNFLLHGMRGHVKMICLASTLPATGTHSRQSLKCFEAACLSNALKVEMFVPFNVDIRLGRQTIPDLERHLEEQFAAQKLDLDCVCAGVTDGGANFVGATKNALLDTAKNSKKVYPCTYVLYSCTSQTKVFKFHIVCICHRLNTALLNVLNSVGCERKER